MIAALEDQEVEIVQVLGLFEIAKYQPAPTVPAGTIFELSLGTFNCVTREVKDKMGVTVTYNGLEYGHIETERGSGTMTGHRIGLWIQDPTVTVTAVAEEPSSRRGRGFTIKVVKSRNT